MLHSICRAIIFAWAVGCSVQEAMALQHESVKATDELNFQQAKVPEAVQVAPCNNLNV
jgi:hypothetical protein